MARLADDCRRRGALTLRVTRGNRVSSSPVVRPCFRRPRSRYESRSGFLWRRLADDAEPDLATPTPCGVALRPAASRDEPSQRCVGFHHRTHECMYSLDAWGVYKVGVVIGATGRGSSLDNAQGRPTPLTLCLSSSFRLLYLSPSATFPLFVFFVESE